MRTALHSRGSIQWLRWKGHDPKGTRLRSHVAVRHSPSLALPAHCELQVMMGEVANGLCESKNLNLLAVGCKWARRAVREATGVWDIQVVVLQCRSWFHFQYGLWLSPPLSTVVGRATF